LKIEEQIIQINFGFTLVDSVPFILLLIYFLASIRVRFLTSWFYNEHDDFKNKTGHPLLVFFFFLILQLYL